MFEYGCSSWLLMDEGLNRRRTRHRDCNELEHLQFEGLQDEPYFFMMMYLRALPSV